LPEFGIGGTDKLGRCIVSPGSDQSRFMVQLIHYANTDVPQIRVLQLKTTSALVAWVKIKSVTLLKKCSSKILFQFFDETKRLTLFFFFLLSPLQPDNHPTNLQSRTGTERGLQDLWQEQERLHRGQGAEVGHDDPGPEVDGRGVPGVLERGRPERRREAGLQRVHQDHAAVLRRFLRFVRSCDQTLLMHLIENDTSDPLNNYFNFFEEPVKFLLSLSLSPVNPIGRLSM